MPPTPRQIRALQDKVLGYFEQNGRDLPWRRTTDPYAIWLSEVMLQQTQVSRVIEYHHKWLKRWPTVQALADSSRREVLRQWMGLGYNNRAVNLHEAAKKIVNEYDGDVLAAMRDFKNIKGIGPYTAHAVRIFSTNENLATVDTNIRRILIHEFGLPETIKDKELWELASRCVPSGKSRDWHNALMDYGATHLTARRSGIRPTSRQSRFEGSDRQIRAKVLRHLLIVDADLETLKSLTIEDEQRLLRILEKMIDERLIRKNGPGYALIS